MNIDDDAFPSDRCIFAAIALIIGVASLPALGLIVALIKQAGWL